MLNHFDFGSLAVIAITLILFIAALFSTGFTHDIFLEAGVFLISVKLIHLAYKNSVNAKDIAKELQDIKKLLQKDQD